MFANVMFPTFRFNELRREMDRLLESFGTGPEARPFGRGPAMAMNIWDEGEALCVEAEVPGISKDDLEILAVGNELTIKGRRQPLTGEKMTYHRQERSMGEFTRSVTLPTEVDADKVEARLDSGVLTLRMPKAEAAKPRQIAVKTA